LRRILPLASFRDGLSNTLALSEKAVGSSSAAPYSPFRDWAFVPGSIVTADEWLATCSVLRRVDHPQFESGHTWFFPNATRTAFFASAPPNSSIPDCGRFGGDGIFAARSYHPGGVNAAMADGSVSFFTSSTDPLVWRSLGTRAGGDLAR
jgi:prepilin-type processing-associated H-X9-DG protein